MKSRLLRSCRNAALWIGGITVAVVAVMFAFVVIAVRLSNQSAPMTLEGRVTDSAGRPLADAVVTARQGHERLSNPEYNRYVHETSGWTDADGRYALEGLHSAGLIPAMGLASGGHGGESSWYTVDITLPGYVPSKAYVPVVPEWTRTAARVISRILYGVAHKKADGRKRAPAAQPPCRGHALSGVDVTLYKPARFEGVVADGLGMPCPDCAVCLDPSTNTGVFSSYLPRAELPLPVTTDAEGRFRMYGVPPGGYRVRVSEEGRIVRAPPFPLLTVREGEDVAGWRFEHDALPFGSVQGVVVDAVSGRPIHYFRLYVNGVKPAVDYVSGNGTWRRLCLCGKSYAHTKE